MYKSQALSFHLTGILLLELRWTMCSCDEASNQDGALYQYCTVWDAIWHFFFFFFPVCISMASKIHRTTRLIAMASHEGEIKVLQSVFPLILTAYGNFRVSKAIVPPGCKRPHIDGTTSLWIVGLFLAHKLIVQGSRWRCTVTFLSARSACTCCIPTLFFLMI